jgi:hypothetical protein
MEISCGYASVSENGTKNGAKGDQTGKEVKVSGYYNFGQNKVIRFKDTKMGIIAAEAMEAVCNNDNIGYGQLDRTTLYSEARRIGWDVNRIGEICLCNTDCSEAAAVAINFAFGREVIPESAYTGSIVEMCENTGLFDALTNFNQSMLQAGDMPIKEGKHIIMVLNGTSNVSNIVISDGGDEWVGRLQSLIGAKVDRKAGKETWGKCPYLEIGTYHNEVVRLVQERMGNFYHIGVTGGYDSNYGNGTNAAVLEFKRQKGLDMSDGNVNADVWRAILKDTIGNVL